MKTRDVATQVAGEVQMSGEDVRDAALDMFYVKVRCTTENIFDHAAPGIHGKDVIARLGHIDGHVGKQKTGVFVVEHLAQPVLGTICKITEGTVQKDQPAAGCSISFADTGISVKKRSMNCPTQY